MNRIEANIRKLSSPELTKIINDDFKDYTSEALGYAVDELKRRANEAQPQNQSETTSHISNEEVDKMANQIEKEKEIRIVTEAEALDSKKGKYHKAIHAFCCECGYIGLMPVVKEYLPLSTVILTIIVTLYFIIVSILNVFGFFQILLWIFLVIVDIRDSVLHMKRDVYCPECRKTLKQ